MSPLYTDPISLFGLSYQTIYNHTTAPESRYIRSYTLPTATVYPTVLPTTMTTSNQQEGWGEPNDMQPDGPMHTQTVACNTSTMQPALLQPTVNGTQSGSTGTCQVAPAYSSGIYTLYMDSDAQSAFAVGAFVCVKAKNLNTEAFNFYGPWHNAEVSGGDITTPQNYGGDDVVFSHVSWTQQTIGVTNTGFKNFSISYGYMLRPPTPIDPVSGLPGQLPCLASSSGGIQVGADIGNVNNDGGLWPAGTNTIDHLYAIGTGDDALAIKGSNGDTNTVTNAMLPDCFARGLFIDGAGTYDAPGTSILQTWTLSSPGTDTIVSTVGTNTLSRNAYCFIHVPGESVVIGPNLTCPALSQYAP